MWQETNKGLYKEFQFKNFVEAFNFMLHVAAVAEEVQHHPRGENDYNTVKIWLITHEAGDDITDKDQALADAIDSLVVSQHESA
jgi:4a-hydroxytetrahydrobiopterin dehydratase